MVHSHVFKIHKFAIRILNNIYLYYIYNYIIIIIIIIIIIRAFLLVAPLGTIQQHLLNRTICPIIIMI